MRNCTIYIRDRRSVGLTWAVTGLALLLGLVVEKCDRLDKRVRELEKKVE